MEHWTDLCPLAAAPAEGEVAEAQAEGFTMCLARIAGKLHALDNKCPHRDGPLSEGWVEGNAVVCPWHAWAFDVRTGITQLPKFSRVAVFPVRIEGETVQVEVPWDRRDETAPAFRSGAQAAPARVPLAAGGDEDPQT